MALAHHLNDEGLEPGDRVVLQVPNGIEFAAGALAVLIAGGVPVLAEPGLGEAVYRSRIRAVQVASQVRQTGDNMYVVGYDGWVRLNDCPGSMVVDMTTRCGIRQTYVRGMCGVEGVKLSDFFEPTLSPSKQKGFFGVCFGEINKITPLVAPAEGDLDQLADSLIDPQPVNADDSQIIVEDVGPVINLRNFILIRGDFIGWQEFRPSLFGNIG